MTPATTIETLHRHDLEHADAAAHLAAAADLAARSLAPRSIKAYEGHYRGFARYCQGIDLSSVSTGVVTAMLARYLGKLASDGCKASTISATIAGVRWGLHRHGRTDDPTKDPVIVAIAAGARRDPARRARGARAVLLPDLVAMLGVTDGVRDRAILLTLFAGALRRDELVRLTIDDVDHRGDVIVLRLAQSKTDQDGAGRYVALHRGQHEGTCPVRALEAWITLRGIDTDSGDLLFRLRSTDSIYEVVTRAASRAGLEGISPHGFRAGHVTTARMHGARTDQIRRTTGHTNDRQIEHYTRPIDATDNSARYLGL